MFAARRVSSRRYHWVVVPKTLPGLKADGTVVGTLRMTALAAQMAEGASPMIAERPLRTWVGEMELAIETSKHA